VADELSKGFGVAALGLLLLQERLQQEAWRGSSEHVRSAVKPSPNRYGGAVVQAQSASPCGHSHRREQLPHGLVQQQGDDAAVENTGFALPGGMPAYPSGDALCRAVVGSSSPSLEDWHHRRRYRLSPGADATARAPLQAPAARSPPGSAARAGASCSTVPRAQASGQAPGAPQAQAVPIPLRGRRGRESPPRKSAGALGRMQRQAHRRRGAAHRHSAGTQSGCRRSGHSCVPLRREPRTGSPGAAPWCWDVGGGRRSGGTPRRSAPNPRARADRRGQSRRSTPAVAAAAA